MGGTLGSDGCPVRSVGPAGPASVPVGGNGPGTGRWDGTAHRRAPHRTGPRRYRPAVGDGYWTASASSRLRGVARARRSRGTTHQATRVSAVTADTRSPRRKARGS